MSKKNTNLSIDKNSSPKFSIITATFNSADTIENCLDSISTQTYYNIEHIIIDGKSTDDTILKINKHSFKPSIIISEPDNGIYEALNKGIENSTGDIIGFLHSDDFFPNKHVVKKIIDEFKKSHTICAVYGDCEFFSKVDSGRTIRKWKSRHFNSNLITSGWMPPHAALYVKSEIIKSINGFDSSFKISGDYMCILQMFTQKNFKAKYLPEVLLKMRMGGASNKSLSNIVLKTREDWKALRLNKFGFLASIKIIFLKNLSKIVQFL